MIEKIREVFQLAKTTEVKNTSYIRTYASLINFFKNKELITQDDLVVGSHMIYGWMPTIVELNYDYSDVAIKISNQAKNEYAISENDILNLSKFINNSVVGASKLLHFINPEVFPIWDSKVYKFIYKKTPHSYRVNNIDEYINYLSNMNELKKCDESIKFLECVRKRVGYDVSFIRGVELIMFINSPSLKSP